MPKNLSNRGFTLIEVLFAFMIMAWSIAQLVQSQKDSMEIAIESRGIIIASQLARSKLNDCKAKILKDSKDGFSVTDFNERGNFSDLGYKDIEWECHGTRIDVPTPNLAALSEKSGNGANNSAATAILGIVFTQLAKSLGNSARELTTVVRWKSAGKSEEIKVTTHLINREVFSRGVVF